MYEVHDISDDFYRIELTRPDPWPESLPSSKNVYLVDGPVVALVDTGHPSQFDALTKAIREAGTSPDAIDRIVATSWSIDALGGIKNFRGVSAFVVSPDMVRPRNYEAYIDSRRDDLRETFDQLVANGEVEPEAEQQLDRFVERYYPAVPSELDFVPIRSGHRLRLGDSVLEVVGAPGPDPGHACLFEPDSKTLYTGKIPLDGFPTDLHDVQSYFVTLERLIDLDAKTVLPGTGRVRPRGTWALQRAHRFVNNFMSNAPSAMFGNPTVTEFIERDLGYRPDHVADFVLRIRTYRALMDELVRSEMIESSGSGLARRYGTDVDDPREKVRQQT